MIPLVRLKENLGFVRDLQDMIEVLKAATASAFRSLQNRRGKHDPFKAQLEDFLASLEVHPGMHPFLREHPHRAKAIILITSDDGFLGGLNALVAQAGLEQAAGNDELIVLGERGARYLSENQAQAFTVLPGIGDEISYDRAVALREFLLEKFSSGKIGSLLVAYPRFLSLSAQRPEVTRLLPTAGLFGRPDRGTSAAAGSAHPGGAKKTRLALHEILFEPSPYHVVETLVRCHMSQRLYDIFWESKLAECAARIMHLEGSHEEIQVHFRRLNYEYFKHMHSKSDKNIREIFASRLQTGDRRQ